jgi:hypothetical protein
MKQTHLIIILFFISSFTSTLKAQNDDNYEWNVVSHDKHEFSVHLGTGLSTLLYDLGTGNLKSGFGMNAGIGYSYTFFRNFSILFGTEIQLFNASVVMSNIETRSDAVDMEGSRFNFRSVLEDYEEKQHVIAFQIPIILHYTTQTAPAFYIGVGVKFAIPMVGKYTNFVGRIQNSGYFSDEEPIYTSPNNVGFGDFHNRKSNGALDFHAAILGSFALGLKFGLGEGTTSLYLGLYTDYDLRTSGMPQEKKGHFVSYDAKDPDVFRVNSILTSVYTTRNDITRSFTDVLKPMHVGIRMRLAFGR